MDFTLDKYRELCAACASSSRECLTVAAWSATGGTDLTSRIPVLRLDVDWVPI